MTETKTKEEQLQEIGKCAMSSIREMVAALECDYDRLEELRDERDTWIANDGGDDDEQSRTLADWVSEFADEAEELKDLEDMAGDCESREDAEQRIHDDPLCIEVRSGWHGLGTYKDECVHPEEFQILLTTGGPAVRIMGEIADCEVHRAYLQVQDWFTPWTDYYEEGADEVLETYCCCFCFDC